MRPAIKVGLSTASVYPLRTEAAFEYAARLGYDGVELMVWADPISHSATEVVATLANDPVHLEGVRHGSRVTVTPDTVVDWAYEKNGKLYGHYTTRALLGRMPAGDRAQVEPLLSPTPLEPTAP